MKCDKCQNETLVYDSRPKDNTIRRRRKCAKCEHRFTTVEMYLTQVNQLSKVEERTNSRQLEIYDMIRKIMDAVVPKPKPAPLSVKKRKLKPRVKRFEDLDFDNMTDEEIERAMEQYS
jgi:transcriptional regulator NrdR family protein